MNRFVVLSVAVLTVTALRAELKGVASLHLAGTEKISADIRRFCALTGNEAWGETCVQSFMQSGAVQYFGPTRAGATILVRVFADSEKTNDCVDAAILYPVVASKAKFLKHHVGVEEKEGVIRWPTGRQVVVFSKDEKWAALASTPACAQAMLRERSTAEHAELGDLLARLDVSSNDMGRVCQFVERARTAGDRANLCFDQADVDFWKSIRALSLGLKVTSAGVDLTATTELVPGTELAKRGLVPYDEQRFASLGRDVFGAAAVGQNGWLPHRDGRDWQEFLALLGRYEIRLDFLKREETPGLVCLTLDPALMVRSLPSLTNKVEQLDEKKFFADLHAFACAKKATPKVAQESRVGAFFIRGCTSVCTPAARLAATLPELAGKKPSYVACGSSYGIVRALLPSLLKLADGEKATRLTPLTMLLAPEQTAGWACAAWREGDRAHGIFRLSAAEIRGFSVLGTLAAVCSSMSAVEDNEDVSDDDFADDSDDDED